MSTWAVMLVMVVSLLGVDHGGTNRQRWWSWWFCGRMSIFSSDVHVRAVQHHYGSSVANKGMQTKAYAHSS